MIVLLIRDGWGINPRREYNAVANARTPNVSGFLRQYPQAVLTASGTAVGLPKGYQGSSEVGHLNMGAGRIVRQEISRINDAIESGEFFRNENFQRAIKNCVKNKTTLHVMGLVQDEGVHAHQDHLFAIMKSAKQAGVEELCVHFFADGRDTPPRSAMEFLRPLNDRIAEYRIGRIGTLMGRYYAMDRGENWRLTDRAYNALTRAEGVRVASAEEAIERAYRDDRTPDGTEMFDEYIPPSIIGGFSGIKDGDSVIHFNYRQDRAIQLTRAFVEDDYPGERWKKLAVVYCGLTRYYDSFRFNILGAIDEVKGMANLLGEVISREGLRQLRIAETQKFRHVTSFFNGKLIQPFKNEDRIEIKSVYDPATFAEHPEMNAFDVADAVVKEIRAGKHDFIVLNFANCDMVGHTGNYPAAVRAVEVVDECAGRVVKETLARDGSVLLTADHGNAEEMVDYRTGLPKTAHTTNPVEFVYIGTDQEKIKLRPQGILSDIAPTVLYLLGIEKPADMTAANLIVV